MTVTVRNPGLYKPKSKLRLRLGLDSPSKPTPDVPHQHQHQEHQAEPVTSTNTPTLSPQKTPATANSLAQSTNTVSSGLSRGDSRSAFALDLSPSTASEHSANPAFDTVSYASASPQSLNFQPNNSSSTSNDEEVLYDGTEAYPTPSPSTSPSRLGHDDMAAHSHPTEQTHTQAPAKQVHLTTSHPNLAAVASGADDIFYVTDEQLSERLVFVGEIGYGNWGSVWQCMPRKHKSGHHKSEGQGVRLGYKSAVSGGTGAGGRVAAKLVHRQKSATTAARVRALWGEMKIIRSLRHEPHPSIINFEAFVISPSYALIIMPYLSHLIPVCLPPYRATPYFRQLASAVGYLHERGITHNDIKPANVLISYADVPVLVDFGFANQWEVNARGSFLSSISWGTPEYLDPQRARGMPHDERASDVWSLGITLFEILIGRTPFEANEEEEFTTPEDLAVYYERSRRGQWIGEWEMPHDLENLLRSMICPDLAYRITAMQAYHHPALQPSAPNVIITPHFVRAAAEFDDFEDPIPAVPQSTIPEPVASPPKDTTATTDKATEKKRRKAKKRDNNKENRPASRGATPLGESIRQHTSMPRVPKVKDGVDGEKGGKTPSPQKRSVIVVKGNALLAHPDRGDEEDNTPTRPSKPAQPLRLKELASKGDKGSIRVSDSHSTSLSHRSSSNTPVNNSSSTIKADAVDKRVSTISANSIGTFRAKNKEEAVLKTMRSLEGERKVERKKSRDVLGTIKRPAPSPPRPRSLDSTVEAETKKNKEDQRRSLGIERRLADLKEESPLKAALPAVEDRIVSKAKSPASPPRNKGPGGVAVASPPRPRVNTRPTEVVKDGGLFPTGGESSPLTELRHKILFMDKDTIDRSKKDSNDDVASAPVQVSTAEESLPVVSAGPGLTGEAGIPLGRTKSIEALGMEGRLDKFALWVKDVERMVEDARKAIAEGREVSLPSVSIPSDVLTGPAQATSGSAVQAMAAAAARTQEHRFGATPDKPSGIPSHLRTSSTQVEPATPPRWMTEQEAMERIKSANSDDLKVAAGRPLSGELAVKKGAKKERPTVSHVLKLFGNDKSGSRSNTPEPFTTVPLKSGNGHALRGAPSTPALRSSTTVRSSKPMGRKSESNLRNFNTMPTLATLMSDNPAASANNPSPRRAVYEDLLESHPGVIRQGDGWSSMGSSAGKAMVKTSSMASLREKALAFLRDEPRESYIHRRESKEVLVDSREKEKQRASRNSRDLVSTGVPSPGPSKERNITDLAAEVDAKRDSLRRTSKADLRRPATPGSTVLLSSAGQSAKQAPGQKGIFGRLKGLVGRKGMERGDEF